MKRCFCIHVMQSLWMLWLSWCHRLCTFAQNVMAFAGISQNEWEACFSCPLAITRRVRCMWWWWWMMVGWIWKGCCTGANLDRLAGVFPPMPVDLLFPATESYSDGYTMLIIGYTMLVIRNLRWNALVTSFCLGANSNTWSLAIMISRSAVYWCGHTLRYYICCLISTAWCQHSCWRWIHLCGGLRHRVSLMYSCGDTLLYYALLFQHAFRIASVCTFTWALRWALRLSFGLTLMTAFRQTWSRLQMWSHPSVDCRMWMLIWHLSETDAVCEWKKWACLYCGRGSGHACTYIYIYIYIAIDVVCVYMHIDMYISVFSTNAMYLCWAWAFSLGFLERGSFRNTLSFWIAAYMAQSMCA